MPRHSGSFARANRAYREHHEELQKLLSRLSVAVTAGDGEGAARLWQVPAFVIENEVVRAINSHQELMELFAGTREMYNARGITDTRPEIVDEDWIGDKLVIVQVRWPYLDEQGREIGAEDSDYTFCRDGDGQLKLRVAVMRGVEGTKDVPPS